MVAWFIIAIATLAVFGFIAVNGVQSVAMTSDAAGRVETIRRLDGAAAAILARARPALSNNVMYLPEGAANPVGQGYGLPADLASVGQTPFGKRFVYCPFGDPAAVAGSTAITITSANGSSYDVNVLASGTKRYVVSGRPAFITTLNQPNLIGYILAPRSKLSATPSCNQVVYDPTARRFTAPDAIVRPITRNGGVDEARTVNARKISFYVSPTGTGQGASQNDPASLTEALAYWRSRLPAEMEIVLAPGFYQEAADAIYSYDLNRISNLTLISLAGPNQVDIALGDANLEDGIVQLAGNLVLNGVNLNSRSFVYTHPGFTTRLVDSAVGGLRNIGGTVHVDGTNTLTMRAGGGWAAYGMEGGVFNIRGVLQFMNPSAQGIIVRSGSAIKSEGGALIFKPMGTQGIYGIFVDVGGSFDCYNCDLIVESPMNYPLHVNGKVDLQAAVLNFPAQVYMAVRLQQGSTFIASSSTIGLGLRAQYGIYDYGAARVGGLGTTIYKPTSSWCWTSTGAGNMFNEDSNTTQSSVLPDKTITPLSAAPTGAEIQVYANNVAANARRAVKRNVNTSDWACQI